MCEIRNGMIHVFVMEMPGFYLFIQYLAKREETSETCDSNHRQLCSARAVASSATSISSIWIKEIQRNRSLRAGDSWKINKKKTSPAAFLISRGGGSAWDRAHRFKNAMENITTVNQSKREKIKMRKGNKLMKLDT